MVQMGDFWQFAIIVSKKLTHAKWAELNMSKITHFADIFTNLGGSIFLDFPKNPEWGILGGGLPQRASDPAPWACTSSARGRGRGTAGSSCPPPRQCWIARTRCAGLLANPEGPMDCHLQKNSAKPHNQNHLQNCLFRAAQIFLFRAAETQIENS